MQLYNKLSAEERARIIDENSQERITLSFYKYFKLGNTSLFRDHLYMSWSNLDILGRIYVANEGINAQLSVPKENFEKFKISVNEFSPLKGIRLNISSWRRPNPNSIPWDTKAAGLYMICTLSKHEAESNGYTDSLMLDHEGNIAEATGANIFFKNETGELHTPTPDSFLDGITRREVIKIAKSKGIKVIERKIKPEEMKNFVGCFLTGTAAEVTPVSEINEYKFKTCNTITDLNESYQALVKKKKAA